MTINRYWLVALIALGSLGLAFPAAAITVSPARLTITADGGAKALVKLIVSNSDSSLITIAPRVVGVKQDEKGRTIVGSGFDAAEKWVAPETASITLAPGAERSIFFSVAPPSGTAPGSHYVGLAVAASLPATSNTLALTGEVTSLLTIQVAGIVNEHIDVTRFELPSIIRRVNSIPATIEMRNTGSIEVPLAGEIRLATMKGKEIFSEPVPLGNALLPDSTRWLAPAINLSPPGLRPGIYTVSFIVTYGLTQQTAAASSTLWYLPLWSLLILGVLLLSCVGIITMRGKRRQSPAR